MQIFRVRFTHRAHYSGFLVCTLHALRLRGSSACEIAEVEPGELLPIPKHLADAGHSHCTTCNREHGLSAVPVPLIRAAFGG